LQLAVRLSPIGLLGWGKFSGESLRTNLRDKERTKTPARATQGSVKLSLTPWELPMLAAADPLSGSD